MLNGVLLERYMVVCAMDDSSNAIIIIILLLLLIIIIIIIFGSILAHNIPLFLKHKLQIKD